MSEASGAAPTVGGEKVCNVYCGEPAAEDRVGVGEVAALDLPKASSGASQLLQSAGTSLPCVLVSAAEDARRDVRESNEERENDVLCEMRRPLIDTWRDVRFRL